jgi:D-aspartate ligase
LHRLAVAKQLALSVINCNVAPTKAAHATRLGWIPDKAQIGVRGRVLLASASAGGTVAAVRHLAANGFEVRLLVSERLGAAAWSRWISHAHTAPPEGESKRFLSVLLDVGRSDPGQILLPTSDETTWLYAKNSAQLEEYFLLYQPSASVFQRILDKKLLAAAASKAGVASLPQWDPESMDELRLLAPMLPYPILVKPRTHVHRIETNKGDVARSASELLQQYGQFLVQERVRDGEGSLRLDPVRPILQQFVEVGSEGVHSIAGFIDRSRQLFVTRRSRKVFQRSRPVGVGVCYESLPPDPSLSKLVRGLCDELGYFGMFEVEFLPFHGGWVVIDFNPRLYNQIGLDIARGLPLPALACLGALDDETELRQAVAKALAVNDDQTMVLYDRFTLRAMLIAMYVTSRISRDDFAYWGSWTKQNAAQAIDVVAAKGDPVPAVIHALSETFRGVRAIRRFSRFTPRVSSPHGEACARHD